MELRVDAAPCKQPSDRSEVGKMSKRSWCRLLVKSPQFKHMRQLVIEALPDKTGFKKLEDSQQAHIAEQLWRCVRGNVAAILRLRQLLCEDDYDISRGDQSTVGMMNWPDDLAEATTIKKAIQVL